MECFSDVFWHLHISGTGQKSTDALGLVCTAKHMVALPNEATPSIWALTHHKNKGPHWVERKQFLDSCGAFNIISKTELHDLRPAADYGMRPMRMKCLENTTGWYKTVGKSYAKDETGKTLVRLAYAYEEITTEPFYLIALSTIVSEGIDTQYHNLESIKSRCPMLRRIPRKDTTEQKMIQAALAGPEVSTTCLLTTQPDLLREYDSNPYACQCTPRVVEHMSYAEYDEMAKDVRLTSDFFSKAKSPSLSTGFQPLNNLESQPYGWDDLVRSAFPSYARLDERGDLDADSYRTLTGTCLMTEIQIQSIVNQQGIESTGASTLDMTTVRGKRVSKWDLLAVEYGEEALQCHGKLEDSWMNRVHTWLQTYVGEKRVFPEKNGAPRIMTEFVDKPYKYELRDEYLNGQKSLPSIKAMYYHGKPATQKVLEHFVRSVPVVSRCDNPRCLSRLVIVPKRDPGALKSAPPTSYRVTMNALINGCLKPTPSTLPLALNEIKKLHHYKYYLKVDAANAYWSIPLDDESRRMTAFQTHEGVFAWDRLTMGTRPASTVQQTAYYRAFDRYLPQKWRHRFATFADDVAAGADTLEELFELLQAIIICFDKAGIQVKASKLVFGVTEISFHNYTISADQTRPKDENLDPIRNCAIPQSVTNVKAFLGCTQQMSHYCQYYGLVAAPLHVLTRDKTPFPKPWLPGTDYDIAFNRLKAMMLNENLFLWNKVSNRRLFVEVDACEFGWGACVYQYAEEPGGVIHEDEGRHRLLSKEPKRVVEWISKAWTEHERELPCFYREALARLLCLEHFRNLIETQDMDAGTTIYTDHAPSTYKGSLSNKGRLSSWRIHETQDLTDMVQTLYKAGSQLGPPHGLADPLSRLPRGQEFYRIQLPTIMKTLLDRLPPSLMDAKHIRVNAEKDTVVAARIVQKWRNQKNPISIVRGDATGPCDFLILAPFADKITHTVARLIKKKQPFAALVPVDLLHEIDRNKAGKIDEEVKTLRESMPSIVIAPLSLVWLISHPDYTISENPSLVLFTESVVTNADTEQFTTENVKCAAHISPNYAAFVHCRKKLHEDNQDNYPQGTIDFIDESLKDLDDFMKDGGASPSATHHCFVQTRSQRRNQFGSLEDPKPGSPEDQAIAYARNKKSSAQPKALRPKGCKRGKSTGTQSFVGSPPPDPYHKWVGHQQNVEPPEGCSITEYKQTGYPDKLMAVKTENGKLLIIVPENQRIRLIKQEHLTVLHVGAKRVLHVLEQKYYWPKMKDLIFKTCQACPDCQAAQVRRKKLNAEFLAAKQKDLPLPRQNYGIDFYGHSHGMILVAMDLVTREILLWLLPSRKQEAVAKALLSGLVFTKGVPLKIRSDDAPEFIEGVVAAMNRYLGVTQISTGGHNARGNATVERVMQTIGHMLRTATDAEYKNIKEFVHCIAFAHNCTFNSAIEMTPFEAGHGLPARTISEARMDLPRLQFTAEEGNSKTDGVKLWEQGLPKKVVDLAHEMALIAQSHSEWYRRMNSERLNAAGKIIDEALLENGLQVYFYKPPTQEETTHKDRKRKHLSFYHGPAKITGKPRDRQYTLEYQGKEFTRDISMIVLKQSGVDYGL